uniref:Lipoprotein n=1 Tax=Caulobacter sp. (strain K31) TaxID=366602 RepID=B0T074_CAUSK
MRVRFVKAAAAASLLALSVAACGQETGNTGQQAQQVSLEGKAVTASGCVRPVESTSCMVVRGPGGGYYDISGTTPAPDPAKGVAISLQGRDQGENTQCGRKLTDVKWSYLNIQCAALPAPAPAAEKAG